MSNEETFIILKGPSKGEVLGWIKRKKESISREWRLLEKWPETMEEMLDYNVAPLSIIPSWFINNINFMKDGNWKTEGFVEKFL